MNFQKAFGKSVGLLMMLIVVSSSVPIVKKALTTEIPESDEAKMIRYRLPNDVIPRMYKIQIEPNMDNDKFTWTGKIVIDIEVNVKTTTLILHASENLVIDENFTNLMSADSSKFTPIEHNRNDVEFLILKFQHEIPTGNYSLGLKFEGSSTERQMVGFYKFSSGIGDETLIVAGTHFEATTARQAFPCWDEPGLKASFRVSIKHYSNYTAVSNMPEIENVETPDGKILTTFDTTPIMSTYLLTFVISNYENIFNEHRNISLHSPKRSLENTRHVTEFSPKVIDVMESYTGLEFGFPRIGSVVMPMYSAAATEHWGLVSYNELALRFNATSDKTTSKDAIEMLIAHELSHSWFGNRVTPLWWNDLWLNEAFAAYFQYFIMDEIYENWRGVELFILRNNQEAAFPIDNEKSFPISSTVITNQEIRKVFGQITYRKGAAVVHMFRNVLGDSVFRKGIQKFMTKYSFKAAVADDLIAEFQKAYDEDPHKVKALNVNETINSWLLQTGYPIVNVTRNYTTGETEVSQRSTIVNDKTTKWWIPLTYATKTNPNFTSTSPTSWISDKEDSVKIDGIDKDDWIVMNIRANGYYRINYDDENWKRLADYLNSDNYGNIHHLNRAQLIDDVFYLAVEEPRRYLQKYCYLTKYLSRETEYLPWRSAYKVIKFIDNPTVSRTNVYKIYRSYFLSLMESYIAKVGFETHETDDHFTKLSKLDLIMWACTSGHSGCAQYASQKVIKIMEDPIKNRVHPDNVMWLYCAAFRGFDDKTANQFANWAFENLRDILISNVRCSENHEIHQKLLNSLLIDGGSRERMLVFKSLLTSSNENFNFAVDYYLENYRAMNKTNSDVEYLAFDVVTDISENVVSRAQIEKLNTVLRLDAVQKDPNIFALDIRVTAELQLHKADGAAGFLQKLWDKVLSSDSLITHIDF